MAYNVLGQTEPATPGLNLGFNSPFHVEGPAQYELKTEKHRTQNNDDLERLKAAAQNPLDSPIDATLRSTESFHTYHSVNPSRHEDVPPTPPLHLHKRESPIRSPTFVVSPTFTSPSLFQEELPTRTASISHHLPLNHPKPDLQSMQGAYVKNVERLEEHAERLSMTSALEEELQRMKVEERQLRRQSSAPAKRSPPLDTLSNSITSVNATARSGGYSPSGYVSDYQDAERYGSWSQLPNRSASKGSHTKPTRQFSYEEQESLPPLPPSHSTPYLSTAIPADHRLSIEGRRPSTTSIHQDRPTTSASNDTSRQAASLFRDFDGTHYISATPSIASRQQSQATRQVSLTAPPLAADARAFKEPQPGQHMVYYPAPVPMMLDLPQKISRQSNKDRERRRVAALSAIPTNQRQSAHWLRAEASGNPNDARHSQQSFTAMPPQLRASVYFDQPSTSLGNLELEGGSAVATLDRILDASKFAPVNAFVDHPIAGQVGSEIYGPPEAQKRKSQITQANRKSSGSLFQLEKQKDKKVPAKLKKRGSTGSLSNMLGIGRRASGGTVDEMGRNFSGESRQQQVQEDIERRKWNDLQDYANKLPDEDAEVDSMIKPGAEEVASDASSVRSGAEENEDGYAIDEELPPAFVGAPTTLLAELQMRKAKQKSRNLTAADVGGMNGMHATLLEMDAVTQLQLKSRKQKHVTLAWEDEAEAERDNFNDDDVPLGVLFPGKQEDKIQGGVYGMGLLAQRNLEESEPLSSRRQRLNPNARSLKSMYAGSITRRRQDGQDEGEETLGERLKRLKAEKEKEQEKPVVAGEFVDEISSQLGLNVANDGNMKKDARAQTPNPEETLGQRRKRLQTDSDRHASNGSSPSQSRPPGPETRHSMASLLSAHPVGGPNARASTYSGRVVSGGSGNSPAQAPGTSAASTLAALNGFGYVNGTPQYYQQQQQQHSTMPYVVSGTPSMPYTTSHNPHIYNSPFIHPPAQVSGYNNPYTPAGTIGYGYGYGQQYPMATAVGPGANMNMGVNIPPMNMNMNMPPMGMGMAMNSIAMGPPLDPKQRDGIERWRQSVA